MSNHANSTLNVFLNRAASEQTYANVRTLLEHTMANDPCWQGTRFRLYSTLFTWIGEDSERAGRLFEQVRATLMQEDFERPDMIA